MMVNSSERRDSAAELEKSWLWSSVPTEHLFAKNSAMQHQFMGTYPWPSKGKSSSFQEYLRTWWRRLRLVSVTLFNGKLKEVKVSFNNLLSKISMKYEKDHIWSFLLYSLYNVFILVEINAITMVSCVLSSKLFHSSSDKTVLQYWWTKSQKLSYAILLALFLISNTVDMSRPETAVFIMFWLL